MPLSEDWDIRWDSFHFPLYIFFCFVLLKFIVRMITRNNHLLGVISVGYIYYYGALRVFGQRFPWPNWTISLEEKVLWRFRFFSYKKWKSFWWHDDDTLYNCVAIGMKELDAMAKDESNVKYKEVETTTTTTKIYIYISKKIYYAVKEYKRDDCLVSPTVCCCCIYFSPSKWGEKRKP